MAANQDEPKPQPSDQTPIARPGDQLSGDDAGSDYQEILENTASRVAQIRSQANFTQVRLTEEQFQASSSCKGKNSNTPIANPNANMMPGKKRAVGPFW